ncbi:flagellar basal-body rod protein FlgG [Frigidibacter sp. MR17.24]|uniref:flagellar basal-body rod protein FlgG n=1 Tax=Frigidibacter sp. MR17.24 TaxID=3127345 RepID=UPI003012F793
MRAMQIAATGMSAQQMRVEVVSNNLANMSTTGYKMRRAEFADLHYQQAARPGSINATDGTMLPTGVQLGLGVRPSAVMLITGQGSISQTNNELDVAIEGSGYIEVVLPSGIPGYTRDGGMKRSPEGVIVTSEGFEIVPGMTIPADTRAISINAAGEVYAYTAGQTQPQQLGQITLAGFINPNGLEAIGSNLFIESPASGPPFVAAPGEEGLGTLRQGYLEESTVDPVFEITELIEAQRGYELNAKVIAAADQILGATVQVR